MSEQVAGTVLSERYALEDRIGVGGMATVYRAIDLTTGSRVAVKILNREFLLRNPEEAERNVKRFRREAEILRLLTGNPYVVQFVDQGVSQAGDHYIAMELLEGEQLRFYIGRGRAAMGLRTFAYHAAHLVRGLSLIHEKNLIHRDLAPDNIVVVKTREGLPWPKYLDFGIGKSVADELDDVTQMLTIMGKPQHFSPEQARGEQLDKRSDVYSLGVLLFEMLTGYVPIEVHSVPDVNKIQKDPPAPISNWREGARVPGDLQDAIMRCLAKNPADRPDLAQLLEVILSFSERLDAGEEFPLPPESEDAEDRLHATADAATRQLSGRPGGGVPEFKEGDKIGRFEVRERIGRGGMGAVYIAWDPVLQREVAMKVATRIAEENARRAILREARASSHLRSENVVTIYDAGTEAGCPYIAMEYVRGPTLGEIVETEGALQGERFWSLASGILDGLMYAHECEKPVIHRDLKPANILCAGRVAKIADFGIATVTSARRLTIGARDPSHTGSTGAEGSVLTISPEQANNKPADRRSDIYSLGCVLYIMATGRAPFQGNQIAVLYQHVTKKPEPPSKINPALARTGIDAVIMKCLEKDPANRYQTVRAVKADLERAFRPRVAARRWLRPALMLAGLAVLVVAGGAIVSSILDRRSPPPARVLSVVQVAGTAVRPEHAKDPYVTRASMLDIEIATQSEGEVRATVSADWLPDPIVRETTLSVARTTTLRIPLPDAGGRDPAKFKVVLDWVDDPSPHSQTEFVVIRDTQSPRVRFRAYDRLYEPGASIRVVRARDVTAVVEDAGGFDEAGKVHQVEVGRDEKLSRVSFTRKRLDTPRGVWRAVVSARDHAGNTAPELPQLLEVVNPEFEIQDPAPGHATGSRELHVALTARLPKGVEIPGLDAGDLNLGEGDLETRFVVGTKSSEPVPLKRLGKGYGADLLLPDDLPRETRFEIEVLFEGEVVKRSRNRFDLVPPVIVASGGGVTVSSAASRPVPPVIVVQALPSGSEEIVCKIDDGSFGVEGVTVEVQMGDEPPQRVPVDTSGSFVLPNTRAEDSLVRVKATDQAGNTASTGFRVIRKGLQVLSVQLAGRSPDAEGRVYVQDDQVAVRITTVGVPASDRAFAMLLDDKGAVQRPVELERLGGAQIFGAGKLSLFPEGAGKVVRTLRIVFGTDAAAARSYSHDIKVVCDREPPSISATIDGTIQEIVGSWSGTRFPTVRLRICDNVGLSERSPERLVKWTRSNDLGKDVVIVPASPPSSQPSCGPAEISFLIVAPGGPPREGRYEFAIEARDRAGNAAARPFAIQLTPPAVALVAIGGQQFPSPVGESSESPLPVRSETVAVTLRAPKTLAPASRLVVRAFPEGGSDTKTAFPLDGASATGTLDLAVPLPPIPDGRRIGRGRLVFLLEDPASQRADELATVYYFFDRDAPSWSVSRANKAVTEAARRDWIKVAALGELRIVVTDGAGSGFGEGAVEDSQGVVASADILASEITIRLKDDDSFRGVAMRELEIGVKDLAGNGTRIPLKLARSKDHPEVKLLAPGGAAPITRDDVIAVGKPRLLVVVDNEAEGFQSVRWIVKRADGPINSGDIELREGQDEVRQEIEWQPAKGAEPYGLEFYARSAKGLGSEPFATFRVQVDATPPQVYMYLGVRPVTKNERPPLKDFEDVRIVVVDTGSGYEPDAVTAEIIGSGGARSPAPVAQARDGKLMMRPSEPIEAGEYLVEITAHDRLGNPETKTFEVTLTDALRPTSTAVPMRILGPASRPKVASERTVANEAIRAKDEERTGISFLPVWTTADRSGPPRFFMSQTEITNEQFLRFVDALRQDSKDPLPRELSFWNDLGRIKKKVEDMRFRFDEFRRDPALPVIEVDPDVSQAFAAWTGGRLPSRDEWIGAAGKYLLPNAEYPVFLERGVARSGDTWMRDHAYAVFQRTGVRDTRRQSVIELLRSQSNAPFGIVGLAGNVAEWVTDEPGSRKVLGTMGGSFKYPYTNDVNNPRLDREPRLSSSDAGIRVVWPAGTR